MELENEIERIQKIESQNNAQDGDCVTTFFTHENSINTNLVTSPTSNRTQQYSKIPVPLPKSSSTSHVPLNGERDSVDALTDEHRIRSDTCINESDSISLDRQAFPNNIKRVSTNFEIGQSNGNVHVWFFTNRLDFAVVVEECGSFDPIIVHSNFLARFVNR